MKSVLFLLLLPLFSYAQTIHKDNEKIFYKGYVTLSGLSEMEVFRRLEVAVQHAAEKSRSQNELETSNGKITIRGKIKLSAPFHIRRNLRYVMQLTTRAGGYDYQIDSVSVTEERRGGSAKIKASKELLEGMEETGSVAIETERLLNEMDMQFQKLLALLENEMRRHKQNN